MILRYYSHFIPAAIALLKYPGDGMAAKHPDAKHFIV